LVVKTGAQTRSLILGEQSLTQDSPRFLFHRATVLCGFDAKLKLDRVIQVSNGEHGHAVSRSYLYAMTALYALHS
jgi:hypothetical protein